MDRGYIKLYRKIFDHWTWDDKPKTKFEAWILLLKMANHESKKMSFGNELINIQKGDIITSEVKLSQKLKWSRSKVRAFILMLADDGMLKQKKDSKKTHLSLCNYSEYNICADDKKTEKEHQKNSEETSKKHNEELKALREQVRSLNTIVKSLKGEKPKVENTKDYPDEIKNFTNSYQEYVLNEFPKIAPKIENSLIEKCCDTIDKLIRLDSFTFKEIYDSIQWASNDDFWKDQILSLAQLRKKAPNGNKKFVNMFTAYQKKDTKNLSIADKRLQSNIQAGEEFENGFK